KSAKIVHYNITPEGVKRKNYLSITYLHELLDLYKLAKENVEEFLIRLEDKGYKDILVYGAGEVAETILNIVEGRKDKPLKIVALIDDNKGKRDEELLGYKIISREEIDQYEHDGIVITSYTYEDEITEKLKEINYPEGKIKRF